MLMIIKDTELINNINPRGIRNKLRFELTNKLGGTPPFGGVRLHNFWKNEKYRVPQRICDYSIFHIKFYYSGGF